MIYYSQDKGSKIVSDIISRVRAISTEREIEMEKIRSYKDMEAYVRMRVEGSWDFIFVSYEGWVYMQVGIEGKHDSYFASERWLAGDRAEEETHRKAELEAESLFEITREDALEMAFSDNDDDRDLSVRFFERICESREDFWEEEYMAAMDDPETEYTIKGIAHDLWEQWKEGELDE